ncbi:tRNA pseudouridine synthase B, partial [Neisseria animalis]
GAASSTGDAEGEIIATARTDISREEFQTACTALTGNIRQVPPMFSALKHEGKPLYEYARQGIVIERKPRDITIYSIEITDFAAPKAVIDVRCSKGTYIRTLSEDIAKQMHTFAHLTALRRTETAGFHIGQTHTLEAIEALDEAGRDALLLPCDVLVRHLPKIELNDKAVEMLKFGQRPQFHENISAASPIRVYTKNGGFVGLVEYRQEIGRLQALRLMNTAKG